MMVERLKFVAVWFDGNGQGAPAKAWVVSVDERDEHGDIQGKTARVFGPDERLAAESFAQAVAEVKNLPLYTYTGRGKMVPFTA